ncbi:hypothetical protein ALC62_09688 [Cyphomyrmex costatus]|uniref:Uncharacterized protein n=1 Tax=Cyphomyrmex costatus TaxID=456900 RepID=A0A151IF87_9HYME|nr:hypothetical protein ALC62_09688 [Cyphomyrmex costatus]
MQFPFDFPFSTPTPMCSQLTQIAVPPWRIFPFHRGDDYLRSTSCYNYVSFRGTLPNPSKTIVDPKPRKFIAMEDSAISPLCGQNQDFASSLSYNLSLSTTSRTFKIKDLENI